MTMRRNLILAYRQGSGTVQRLARTLDLKGIRLENSQYVARDSDVIINWGNSDPPVSLGHATVINDPERVRFVSNKLNFFRMVSDFNIPDAQRPRIPDWTQDQREVAVWLEEDHRVFVRNRLTGHSGEGIDILEPKEYKLGNIVLENYHKDTLCVKYVKKKHEYRLHFFRGEIFDVQKKSKVNGREDANFLIRNHANGFIYSRNNLGDVPEDVMSQTRKTVALLTMDFGAVDVIWNQLRNEAYVLEVNSAPGLEGTTLTNYCTKFRSVLNNNETE